MTIVNGSSKGFFKDGLQSGLETREPIRCELPTLHRRFGSSAPMGSFHYSGELQPPRFRVLINSSNSSTMTESQP